MIESVLTEEEIKKVQEYVANDVPYNELRKEFPQLDKTGSTVVFQYYKKLKAEKSNGWELGFKNEPYYEGDAVDELYPQYSWKKLSKHEKDWYNVRRKRGINHKI